MGKEIKMWVRFLRGRVRYVFRYAETEFHIRLKKRVTSCLIFPPERKAGNGKSK